MVEAARRTAVMFETKVAEPEKKVYMFNVPSGIGDISWLYSKLLNIPEVSKGSAVLSFHIADGWPYRALPYVNMLPCTAYNDYGNHEYKDIIEVERVQKIDHNKLTWQELKDRGYGAYFIQNNEFLERGTPLAKWCPDLLTTYHYPLIRDEAAEKKAQELLTPATKTRPLFGVFGSSKRGVKLWKGWLAPEWLEFIKMVKRDFDPHFVLMGAQWDHEIMDEIVVELDKEKIEYTNITGRTMLAAAVEVLKLLNYFMCFSSGLNVLSTVVGTPCCAMWPDFQHALRYAWAPPDMIQEGSYKAFVWCEPFTVFDNLQPVLRKYLK